MDIELWDGTVIEDVPDGMSRSEIRMGLLKRGINPDPPADRVNPTDGMSGVEKFGAGVGKSFVDTGRGAKQLLNIGDQDQLAQTIAEDRELSGPLTDTGAGMAGLVTGALAQTLAPGGAVLRAGKALNSARTANAGRSLLAPKTYTGAAAQGAAFGATQPTLTDGEAWATTGLGTLGGLGGQALAKTVGTLAKPLSQKLGNEEQRLAQVALDEGIPLTAADRTGTKPLLSAVMENLPFTAGKQGKLLDMKAGAFNRAVLKRAGIDADEAAPQILDAARKELGSEFERLSAGRKVPLGDGFLNKLADLDAAQGEVRGVLDTSKIDRLVTGMLDRLGKGALKGETAQTIRSELTKEAKDAAAAQQSRLADALRTVRNAVDDAIGDTMTGADRKAWGEARRKYTALKTIQKAMDSAPGQAGAKADIAPSALTRAVRAGDKGGYAYGRGDLNDLSRAGELFVRKSVPDSGTAQRLFLQNLMTGSGVVGTGGLATALTGDPSWMAYGAAGLAAPVALQRLIATPAMQKYLADGVVKNPGLVSELLRRTSVAGGAPLALSGN